MLTTAAAVATAAAAKRFCYRFFFSLDSQKICEEFQTTKPYTSGLIECSFGESICLEMS